MGAMERKLGEGLREEKGDDEKVAALEKALTTLSTEHQ